MPNDIMLSKLIPLLPNITVLTCLPDLELLLHVEYGIMFIVLIISLIFFYF